MPDGPSSDTARGGLDDQPFTWQLRGDGSVAICWHGKPAGTLRGAAAAKLLNRLESQDPAAQQLALAKVTRNFKRGNERA